MTKHERKHIISMALYLHRTGEINTEGPLINLARACEEVESKSWKRWMQDALRKYGVAE